MCTSCQQQNRKGPTSLRSLEINGGEPATRTPDQRIMIRGKRANQRWRETLKASQSGTWLLPFVSPYFRFLRPSVPPLSRRVRWDEAAYPTDAPAICPMPSEVAIYGARTSESVTMGPPPRCNNRKFTRNQSLDSSSTGKRRRSVTCRPSSVRTNDRLSS